MSKAEHARRAILELIASDPNGDWNVHHARLAELQKRIEHLEKKGWHENAKACAEELKRLRALKGLPPE